MEKISVIVPVYKVEPYLDRCVQSIVDQTYENLEIILVDDGSPDNCPAMCDAWAKKDPRIRVIHKPNGGLSDARNAGMAAATGDYLAFVDSDDQVSVHYLEFLYRAIEEQHADLSACDLQLVYEDRENTIEPPIYQAEAYASEQALETLIHGTGFRAVAWNKLYRRSLLEGEAFAVGRCNEDEFFTYRILAKTEHLAYVDAKLYYYLQRAGSIMQTATYRRLDALDAGLERLQLLKAKYPSLYREDKLGFCVSCVLFYGDAGSFQPEDRRRGRARIRKCRAQVHFGVSELKGYTVKSIVYILGSRFCIGPISKALAKRRMRDNG